MRTDPLHRSLLRVSARLIVELHQLMRILAQQRDVKTLLHGSPTWQQPAPLRGIARKRAIAVHRTLVQLEERIQKLRRDLVCSDQSDSPSIGN